MKIRSYKPGDKKELIRLWKLCNLITEKNDPEKDIKRKLKVRPDWLLIGEDEGKIVASVMIGYEGHRGWINYLAVEPQCQKKGFGKKIMDKAEKELKKIGCPKINLQVRKGNETAIDFYKKIGFLEDAAISMGKRLINDAKNDVIR